MESDGGTKKQCLTLLTQDSTDLDELEEEETLELSDSKRSDP